MFLKKKLFGSDGIKKKCCMEFSDSLCKPKCVGGLDLKRVVDFNKALIAKLGQMLAEENSEEWGWRWGDPGT